MISDEKVKDLTQGKDYTVNDRQVTLAAPTGLKIKIYRGTTTKPLVGWADASVLRAADMTVQSTQLLHLAEETSDLAQDGGLSKDTADNVWDARYNKIKNLLDPTDPGDAVTLNYITKNKDSLINQLNATGANQNTLLIATGNTHNARLNDTGDLQNTRLTTTGNNYVSTMTSLKDTTTLSATEAKTAASNAASSASASASSAITSQNSASSSASSASTATQKATEASNSAELAKKWAMSDSSPDGVSDNKSSKTWANEAKDSATSASYSASISSNEATKASNSASAAAKSAENAKTWDPTQYVQSVTESNGKITVTKGGGDSTLINLIDTFYPVGSVYMSADKTKTKEDFPFMAYGTWEEVPANLCLQTGNASEAGTQRKAGLPNITGELGMKYNGGDDTGGFHKGRTDGQAAQTSALFYKTKVNRSFVWEECNDAYSIGLDASKANFIYGSSDTVQPPAYMVRAWVRTA